MENSKSLAIVAAKALPALSGSSLTYNAEKNVFYTLGYTSAVGNTYYRAIRLSDRLAVYYHIGEGYAYTFLNGITLFRWDGGQARIIGQRFWGDYNWCRYSDWFAKEQTVQMLKEYLEGALKASGESVSSQELLNYARSMVEEMHRPQIA